MNKYIYKFFIIFVIYPFSFLMASSEKVEESVQSSGDLNRVFNLTKNINIGDEAPSIKALLGQAKKREGDLIALYNDIRENITESCVFDRLSGHVEHIANEGRIKGYFPADKNLLKLYLLNGDYCVERDLVIYFTRCLEAFQKTVPTIRQIQTLYNESAYVVRQNLESLKNVAFIHLANCYPVDAFFQGANRVITTELKSKLALDSEELIYLTLIEKIELQEVYHLNSLQVLNAVNFFLEKDVIHNPAIIQEINSIQLYLNIERALLAYCPEVIYQLNGYSYQDFILAKLKKIHCGGRLISILFAQNPDPRLVRLYSPKGKLHNAILKSMTDFQAMEARVLSYVESIIPPEKKNEAIQKSKKTKKKRTQKSKKKNSHVHKSYQKNLHQQKYDDISAVNMINKVLSIVEDQDLDYNVITEADVSEGWTEVGSEKKKPKIKKITPYTTAFSYDDYVYKRHMTTREKSGYLFAGRHYKFPLFQDFDKSMMRTIKKKIHHSTKDSLPNLASYIIDFHFQNNESLESQVARFNNGRLYVSGGHYFETTDAPYQKKHHIFCAMNDFLTLGEQKICFQIDEGIRSITLGKMFEEKIRDFLVRGGWKNNCLDSEALLLLDLQEHLVDYLTTIMKQSGLDGGIKLYAVALQIQSYRDACWRCRNLIQGWQHDLASRLAYLNKNFFEEKILIPDNFATIVEVVSEVGPKNIDTFQRSHHKELVVLEKGTKINEQHKITSVKP